MAGRLLPARHRLAGGGAGEGLLEHRHSGRRATRADPESRNCFAPTASSRDPGFDAFSSPRNDGRPAQIKSPPAAEAVVPCSRNALMTLRPTFHLCASSGPSTSRCERTWLYHLASVVSWL